MTMIDRTNPPATAPALPGAVKIGAAVYTLRLSKRVDSDGHNGVMQGDKSRISLSPKCSDSMRRDVLVHELLHAICWQYAVSHVLGWDSDDEERAVRLLAPSLLALIRDNPDVYTYLTAED